jgi:hypothetical protein
VRLAFFLGVIICCTSCNYFTAEKKDPIQALDSISFTSVDVSPSFQVCDSIIDSAKKDICFRETIYKEITQSLAQQKIQVKKEIDEMIQVSITIHSNKKISLKSIEASQNVYEQIPNIKEIIARSIQDLPTVFPAIKRSIPVTSEYLLPIRIQLEH